MTPINCTLFLHGNTHSVLSVVQLGCLKISVVRMHGAKFSAVRRPEWTSRGDSLHWGLTGTGCIWDVSRARSSPHLLEEETHTNFGSCLLKLTQIHQCGTVKRVLSVWESVNTNRQILNSSRSSSEAHSESLKRFFCDLFTF